MTISPLRPAPASPNAALCRLWHDLGRMQAAHGLHGKAAGSFATAINMDPGHLPSWVALATANDRAGNASGCVQACRQVLSMDPGNPVATTLLEKHVDGRETAP